MKMIVIDRLVSYPKNHFKQVAVMAWDKFFKIVDERVDIAHWNISADSGTVRLSARVSSIDESGPDRVALDRVYARVQGIVEILNSESDAEQEETYRAFRDWTEEGIIEAFKSVRIQNKFKKFVAGKSGRKEFAIVTADMDWGLCNDELSMLWTNTKKVTIAVIKERQKPRKRHRARKCTPKELKRKG